MEPELPAAELVGRIEQALAAASGPLTVKEIAASLQVRPDEVAEVVWSDPLRFSWQPRGRWTPATAKAGPGVIAGGGDHEDTRPAVIDPQGGVELRAMKLASGATLRVVSRPLDSAALFTVRSEGADLQLILNSSHEVFEAMPMPFEKRAESDSEALAELLLAAWAVSEAEAPVGAKRGLEDARLLWGRRLVDLLESPS